jgi:hypothetical protein
MHPDFPSLIPVSTWYIERDLRCARRNNRMIPDRIGFLGFDITARQKRTVASRPPGESTGTKGLLLYQVSKITNGERDGDLPVM